MVRHDLDGDGESEAGQLKQVAAGEEVRGDSYRALCGIGEGVVKVGEVVGVKVAGIPQEPGDISVTVSVYMCHAVYGWEWRGEGGERGRVAH